MSLLLLLLQLLLLLLLLLQLLLTRGGGDEARFERAQVVKVATETLVRHLWRELVAARSKNQNLEAKKSECCCRAGCGRRQRARR